MHVKCLINGCCVTYLHIIQQILYIIVRPALIAATCRLQCHIIYYTDLQSIITYIGYVAELPFTRCNSHTNNTTVSQKHKLILDKTLLYSRRINCASQRFLWRPSMCVIQLARSKSDGMRRRNILLNLLWTSLSGRHGAARIRAAFCNVHNTVCRRSLWIIQ